MSDVLGSALIEVQPDFTQFERELTRGLQQAAARAEKAAQIEIQPKIDQSAFARQTRNSQKDVKNFEKSAGGLNEVFNEISNTLKQVAINTMKTTEALKNMNSMSGRFKGPQQKELSKFEKLTDVFFNLLQIASTVLLLNRFLRVFKQVSAEAGEGAPLFDLLGKSIIKFGQGAGFGSKVLDNLETSFEQATTQGGSFGDKLLFMVKGLSQLSGTIKQDAIKSVNDLRNNTNDIIGTFGEAAETAGKVSDRLRGVGEAARGSARDLFQASAASGDLADSTSGVTEAANESRTSFLQKIAAVVTLSRFFKGLNRSQEDNTDTVERLGGATRTAASRVREAAGAARENEQSTRLATIAQRIMGDTAFATAIKIKTLTTSLLTNTAAAGSNALGISGLTAAFGNLFRQGISRESVGRIGASFGNIGASVSNLTGRLGPLAAKLSASATGIGAITVGAIAAGSAIVGLAQKASRLQESTNAVNVTLGAASEKFRELIGDSADLGLSNTKLNESITPIVPLLRDAGLEGEPLANTMDLLVRRGVDLASVFNEDVGTAIQRLGAGIRGEIEPLRRLGASFNATDIELKAASLGFEKVNGQIPEQAKQLARLALTVEKTAFAADDFKNTQDSLANAQRRLGAEFSKIADTISAAFLPAAEAIIAALANLLDKIGPPLQRALQQMEGPISLIGSLIGGLVDLIAALPLDFMTDGFAIIGRIVGAVNNVLSFLVNTFVSIVKVLSRIALAINPVLLLFAGLKVAFIAIRDLAAPLTSGISDLAVVIGEKLGQAVEFVAGIFDTLRDSFIKVLKIADKVPFVDLSGVIEDLEGVTSDTANSMGVLGDSIDSAKANLEAATPAVEEVALTLEDLDKAAEEANDALADLFAEPFRLLDQLDSASAALTGAETRLKELTEERKKLNNDILAQRIEEFEAAKGVRDIERQIADTLMEREELEGRLLSIAEDRETIEARIQELLAPPDPGDVQAAQDRLTRTQINLNKTKRQQLKLEEDLLGVQDEQLDNIEEQEGLQVDLTGLTLDEARSRLASARAAAAAKRARKETKEELEEESDINEDLLTDEEKRTLATLDVRDAEREVEKAKKAVGDLLRPEITNRKEIERLQGQLVGLTEDEESIKLRIRRIDEDAPGLVLRKQEAEQEYQAVLNGEAGIQLQIKGLTEEIITQRRTVRDLAEEERLIVDKIRLGEEAVNKTLDARKLKRLEELGIIEDTTTRLGEQLKQQASTLIRTTIEQALGPQSGERGIVGRNIRNSVDRILTPEFINQATERFLLAGPNADLRTIIRTLIRELGLDVSGFAEGGVVQGAPGPMGTLIRAGEFGRSEAILPLTKPGRFMNVLQQALPYAHPAIQSAIGQIYEGSILSGVPRMNLGAARAAGLRSSVGVRSTGTFESAKPTATELKLDRVIQLLEESNTKDKSVNAPITINKSSDPDRTARKVVRELERRIERR